MSRPDADIETFLNYWKSLRNDGETIVRSDVFIDNPNPLFASNTLILDYYPDDIIIRLQATELVERWGEDKTGQSMFDAPLPMNKSDMLLNVSRLIKQPCGLLSAHQTRTSGGRILVIETLGLPLLTPPDKPKRMVNYSWLINPLKDGEHSQAVTTYEKQEWIDIGAGIPSAAPLKPMLPK